MKIIDDFNELEEILNNLIQNNNKIGLIPHMAKVYLGFITCQWLISKDKLKAYFIIL